MRANVILKCFFLSMQTATDSTMCLFITDNCCIVRNGLHVIACLTPCNCKVTGDGLCPAAWMAGFGDSVCVLEYLILH